MRLREARSGKRFSPGILHLNAYPGVLLWSSPMSTDRQVMSVKEGENHKNSPEYHGHFGAILSHCVHSTLN